MSPTEITSLVSNVYTQFSAPEYVKSRCRIPVTISEDPSYKGNTCLQIEHVGMAYHNYEQYISNWGQMSDNNISASENLIERPPPIGNLYDNTSVTGSWIDISDTSELSAKYNRMVINVTAALPHSGVINAAHDPRNKIQQPQSTTGEGKYVISAGVASPAINVLCVGVGGDEIEPLIYNKWPNNKFNPTTWVNGFHNELPQYPSWLNRTVVDDLFKWGPDYGERPPIFGKLPQPYNTIVNATGQYSNAVYLLAASPGGQTAPTPYVNSTNPEYTVCSLRAKMTNVCSTNYEEANSGAKLYTTCNKPDNKLQYNRTNNAPYEVVWNEDWRSIAQLWASAVNLDSGISDSDASNARLLTQTIPQSKDPSKFTLDPKMPSISEALAVMASSTLLIGSMDSTFRTDWTYPTQPNGYFQEPVNETFTSSLKAMGYASGPTSDWQKIFYVVLVFAFVTSAICLVFVLFGIQGRPITDFTEPLNMFALAVNSPSSGRMHGACGCGPDGEQLTEPWVVGMEEDREHYYIRTKAEEKEGSITPETASVKSPRVHEYRRLSSKRGSWLV